MEPETDGEQIGRGRNQLASRIALHMLDQCVGRSPVLWLRESVYTFPEHVLGDQHWFTDL